MSVKREIVDFMGFKNSIRLYNDVAELVILTDVGPRIISYKAFGGKNQFCVNPDQMGKTGGSDWRIMGGHRLWTSPELKGRSDEPDNEAVGYEFIKNGVKLLQKPSEITKTQKTITVTLDEKSSKVNVLHEIKNLCPFEIEVSAWALSVLDEGGLLAVEQVSEDTLLLPNRTLSLWAYSKMNDKRVYFGEKYITLKQDNTAKTPFKFGMFADSGYAAYFNHSQLFVKRFAGDLDFQYPDWNCNFESYTCDFMLECESLSPLELLAQNESVSHEEEWELFDKVPCPDRKDEAAIEKALDGKI